MFMNRCRASFSNTTCTRSIINLVLSSTMLSGYLVHLTIYSYIHNVYIMYGHFCMYKIFVRGGCWVGVYCMSPRHLPIPPGHLPPSIFALPTIAPPPLPPPPPPTFALPIFGKVRHLHHDQNNCI